MADDEVFRRIRDRLQARREVEVRLLRVTPAMLTREGTPLEQVLATHASAPGTGAAPFATDGGNLARLGMLPLVFGPGSIDVAHKADEYVPEADLHHAVGVVEQVIRSFCTDH
jgi:acetylornithine deacetylase